MGAQTSRNDFEWVYTPEPHATRRKEILAKHPEIKQLFGHDYSIAVWTILLVAMQITISYMISVYNPSWPVLLVLCYVGGTFNHSLFLAMHEIAHNLAFGYRYAFLNRILGFIANLPTFVPSSLTFRKYHLDHHKYQGDDYLDTDLPSYWEGWFFTSPVRKFFWIIINPFLYALRPVFTVYKAPTLGEVANLVVCGTYNVLCFQYFGFKSLMYHLLGSLMSMGMHPVAGHFISEHYMFVTGVETYSYYGNLNWISFNVGYHNEHHDFPNVPGSRLPQVKALAPEFYDHLPKHESWWRVLIDFITCPEIGPFARIRRKSKYRPEAYVSAQALEDAKSE